MLIRILDLQNFDETLNLPDSFTVDHLIYMIQSNFHYDLSASTFYHNGAELRSDVILKPENFSDSNVVVLFNARIFPQKSFPRVDHAFHFFPSRFQEYYFASSLTDELNPPAEQSLQIDGFRRFVTRPGLSHPFLFPSVRGQRMQHMIDVPDHDDIQPFEFDMFPGAIDNEEDYILDDAPEFLMDLSDLTPADLEAIRRLEELGFDRSTVIPIYIACNRNEARAENTLMAIRE
jgi:hypothetical protein